MPRYSNYGSLDNVMVDEGDVAFNRVNARLRPDQLKEGDVAYSSNGRMDLGGAWQPRKGITNFDTAITLNTAALRLPFYLYANTTASSYSEAAGVITINFATAHPFVNGTLASISGLSGSTPSVNGNRTITVNSSTQIEITVAGLSGSITGTAVVGAPRLEDDAVNSVYGSCLFSDPNTNNTEYIVIATTEFAYAIKLSDGSETPIDYPAGVSISADVGMLQAFDKVFIFRDGLTALEWNGVLTGTPAFTLVENGAYTVPAYLDDSNNTEILDGRVTVTQTAAHGLSVGDRVYVIDKGSSGLVENGAGYVVAEVTSSTVFKFFAAVDDLAPNTVIFSRRISVGTGFTHMPAPPFAIYHQRRLWMPYLYTMSGSPGPQRLQTVGLGTRLLRPTSWTPTPTTKFTPTTASRRVAQTSWWPSSRSPRTT
jgi:hypothetical protein